MKKNLTGFTLIELLIVMAIIGLLAAIVVGAGGGCSRSEGSRVGTVTKFSYKGMTTATKSWEGELTMGGMRNGLNSSVVANVWAFSVLDPAVVKQVDALQDSGHRAKLHYRQSFTHNPMRRETSYYVVEAIDLDAGTNAPVKAER